MCHSLGQMLGYAYTICSYGIIIIITIIIIIIIKIIFIIIGIVLGTFCLNIRDEILHYIPWVKYLSKVRQTFFL